MAQHCRDPPKATFRYIQINYLRSHVFGLEAVRDGFPAVVGATKPLILNDPPDQGGSLSYGEALDCARSEQKCLRIK